MTGGDVSDLELLEVEIETLWPMDEHERITTGPDLVIASAPSGSTAAVGSAVSNQLAAELKARVRQSRSETVSGSPPPVLEHCRRLLEAELGPVELMPASGPSYLIPDSIAFPAAVRLVRSNEPDIAALRDANPGNWEAEEWQDLLDGRLGPWVMALDHGLVIAICHTPRSGARGAEAGVWTRPGFRGRGHAAAVTAAWAALVRPDGRRLFYSAARTNLSSQRVAARLGLRPLGWLWQLARRIDGDRG